MSKTLLLEGIDPERRLDIIPHDGVYVMLGIEEGEEERGELLDAICLAHPIHVICSESEPDAYVARTYLQFQGGETIPARDIFAGTIYRFDRFPTLQEIAEALGRWRELPADTFQVHWRSPLVDAFCTHPDVDECCPGCGHYSCHGCGLSWDDHAEK